MGDLINYAFQILEYIPTNLVNLAIITYLILFRKEHTKEHHAIINQVRVNSDELKNREINYESDRELMLKGLITNDNLPNFVRLDFYKRYKEMGCNSWVDAYVEDKIKCTTPRFGRRFDDEIREHEFNENMSFDNYRFEKKNNEKEPNE